MASEIGKWLESRNLGQFIEIFDANEIDVDAARDLTEADLRELDIPMGPRKKLLRAIATLNSGEDSPPPEEQHTEIQKADQAGEHRQVTVLFADISGYTELSAELGAEETHRMLSAYFNAADAIIENHGGQVDKHIGDSVMAVFGAPIAHSNDTERAVRAALAIHDVMEEVSREIGRPVRVHIGLASGQVVASGVGADDHYTVTGDSVNLASRLTDEAGAGETLISSSVQQAAGPACEFEKRGKISLKGIPEPVQVFKLKSYQAAPSLHSSRPFVGRKRELQHFSAALEACLDSDMGQVVYLRGEAGIGKTRLTEEFARRAIQDGFDVHRVLVLDFGVGKGQDAIDALVRSLLSLPAQANPDTIAAAASDAVGSDLVSKEQAIFLNDLLGVEQSGEARAIYNAMDNARRNQGKRDTVATLMRNISRNRKLMVIVEDVHWADQIVLGQLASLTGNISDLPVILIMTSRIEGDPLDQAWRASISSTPILTIDLKPLQNSEALALASDFFDVTGQFAKSCVERADGNPLFLEQLLRGAESTAQGGVPGSVQSIVQSRMDALEATDRQALQAASVLGQRFSLDALRHLIESTQYDCDKLIEHYLVRPEQEDFLFAHALVQEGVYNSLLASRRGTLHVRAAGWFRKRDLVLCAEHLDRAGDPSASKSYLDAAVEQVEALRYEHAAKLANRGIELDPDDPEIVCDLYRMLADSLLNTGSTDDAIDAYQRATQFARTNKQECAVWTGLASALRVADRQAKALQALEKAEQAAKRERLTAELAFIHYLRGNLFFPLGRIEECLAEHESSYELAREVGSPKAEARALGGLGDARYLQGQMPDAHKAFKSCVDLAEKHGFVRIAVANRHMVGWTRIHMMEFREAHEDGVAAASRAAQVSHRRAEIAGLLLSGATSARMGYVDEAAGDLEKCVDLAKRIGAGNFAANALMELALVKSEQGDRKEARELIQHALDISRELGMTFVGPAVLAAWASLHDDDRARRNALKEAESILDSGCVAHNHPWFADTAIKDALNRGEWDRVEHFALRLQTYASKHQRALLWDFLIERAHALATWNRNGPNHALEAKIEALIKQANEAGLASSLPPMRRALEQNA